MEQETEVGTVKSDEILAKETNECPKGGKHEFGMVKGELGMTYEACVKCNCPPPFSGHLGAH